MAAENYVVFLFVNTIILVLYEKILRQYQEGILNGYR